ncbi:MAG: PIN domain-containing protein [Tepidisphaeraceae bacterium]
MAVLVDTSSWVETLRAKGRPEVRERVERLVKSGQAVWCDAVRLELWNGRSGVAEQKALAEFDEILPRLAIDDAVWSAGVTLARRARTEGLTVPAIDLLIAACAFRHRAAIESCDEHFKRLAALK